MRHAEKKNNRSPQWQAKVIQKANNRIASVISYIAKSD
jgi:hypothetical protein